MSEISPLTHEQILNSQLTRVLVVDDHFVILYANLAAQQLLYQSARKLIGAPLPEVVNYISLDLEDMREHLHSKQSFTDSEVVLVINRQAHILTLSAQSLGNGLFLIELSPLDNLRSLGQEQLHQAQQVAARDLIRDLAHEIKNPLGGLRGAAQLLERDLTNPELKEYTQMIIAQADRLRNLVDRLLGPQKPGKKVTQTIHQVMERIYQLLNLEKSATVTIIRDYDPSLPEFTHDPEQIEQVLLNIGRNALQAVGDEGGEITLRTRTAYQTLLHGQRYRLAARIDIEDNGPGIPPQIQDMLFYPSISGRHGGSGLGLSIAENLINQHNGKIEFASWPGHTEFSVYLPIRQ